VFAAELRAVLTNEAATGNGLWTQTVRLLWDSDWRRAYHRRRCSGARSGLGGWSGRERQDWSCWGGAGTRGDHRGRCGGRPPQRPAVQETGSAQGCPRHLFELIGAQGATTHALLRPHATQG
jgi:hypothetical protein